LKDETWQSEAHHTREALIYSIRKKLCHRRCPKRKFNKRYLASPLRLSVWKFIVDNRETGFIGNFHFWRPRRRVETSGTNYPVICSRILEVHFNVIARNFQVGHFSSNSVEAAKFRFQWCNCNIHVTWVGIASLILNLCTRWRGVVTSCPCTHWVGGWLGPTAVPSGFGVANRLELASFKPQTAQPIASHYIAYTISVLMKWKELPEKLYSITVFPNLFSRTGFIIFLPNRLYVLTSRSFLLFL